MSDLSAATLTRANLRDQLLALYPELVADETTLLDTLSGLDDFEEQVLAVLRHALEREAHAKALGELIEGMTARKQRLENGAKSLRSAALHAMQEAGVKKIPAPDMTVSVGVGKPKLTILNEAAVPDELCRIKRDPDKKAIALWIFGQGSAPDWAVWGNAAAFLTIHRK